MKKNKSPNINQNENSASTSNLISKSAVKSKKTAESANNGNRDTDLIKSEKRPFFDWLQSTMGNIDIKFDSIIKTKRSIRSSTPIFAFGNEIMLAQLDEKGSCSFQIKIISAKKPFMAGLCRRDQVTDKNLNRFHSSEKGYDRGCFLFSTDYKIFNTNKKSEDGFKPLNILDNYQNAFSYPDICDNYILGIAYFYRLKTLSFAVYSDKENLIFETELKDVYSQTAKEDSTGLSPVFVFAKSGVEVAVKSFSWRGGISTNK